MIIRPAAVCTRCGIGRSRLRSAERRFWDMGEAFWCGNRRDKAAARSGDRGFRPASPKTNGDDPADLLRGRPRRNTAPVPPQAKAGASRGDKMSWAGPTTTPVPSRPWSAARADRRPIPRTASRARLASAGAPPGRSASHIARPTARHKGRAAPALSGCRQARYHSRRLPPLRNVLGIHHGLDHGGHPRTGRRASFRGSGAASRSRRYLMHRLRSRRSQGRAIRGEGRLEDHRAIRVPFLAES